MDLKRMLLAASAAVTIAAAPALASSAVASVPAASVQDAKLEVDIDTDDDGAWYVQPVWLAIGGLALLVVIGLIVSASRGRGSNTTVVK